jgi:hypothetical protein
MKINIVYKVNGEKYDSSDAAINKILNDDFKKRISRLEDAIAEQNGSIKVNFFESSYKVHVKNVNDDLSARIEKEWP